MKLNFTLYFFFVYTIFSSAQIVIGKEESTNSDVSLEFGNSENRGIILPYVTDKSEITAVGSIIYDAIDFKVKYLNGPDNWIDMTTYDVGVVDLSLQGNDKINFPEAKIIIGNHDESEAPDGVLVLSDNDKAMILPKVESPHLTILNPSAGLMVYDTLTKQLAFFNGVVWSFWKP